MHTLDIVSPLLGAVAMLAVGLVTGLPAAAGWPALGAATLVCALVMRLAGPIPGVLASAAVHGLLTRGGRAPSPTADAIAAGVLYITLVFTAASLALLVTRLLT